MIRHRHPLSLRRLRTPLSFYSSQPELHFDVGDTDRAAARNVAGLIIDRPSAALLSSDLPPLLASLSPTSLLLVFSHLRCRSPSPSASALSLFRLALRLRLPSLDHRHSSFLIHLLLRRSGPAPALKFLLSLQNSPPSLLHDKLFNPLLRSLAPRRALSLFRLMRSPSFDVSPSTFTFNSLLSVLLRHGQTHNARQLFDEMLQTPNAPPDACTFNTLVRGFCLSGSLDEAFEFFSLMRERHGCRPDVVTYNSLLDGLCRAGKVQIARNFLTGMKRKGGDVSPNVVSYTTMIRGFCGRGDVDAAVEVLDEMIEMGLKPNEVTYNTLVKGMCEARRMDLVKEVLERGDGVGFRPDTCTFNTLMAAHCSSGNVEDAVKVFDRMMELQVKTDSASYSTLIRGLCERGEFERAEKLVDELLEKGVLRRREVCVPLVAAYNPILKYLCQNGKAEKAGTLLNELLERRATMDVAAFKVVILGYCYEGKLREGYKLLVLMVQRNLKPDFEVFEVLINGFLEKEDMVFAWKALERMLNCGPRPSTSMFHSVLAGLLKKDGLAEEAGNLVAVMVERKIRHNIDCSTDVVACLLRMGLNDRAFKILGLLYGNGYCIKMVKIVESLCKDKKYLEARDLLLFGVKRNENLDADLYGRVISGLCANGKASEAFELFFAMTEKGDECPSSHLSNLRNALEIVGRLREAEFVSKQINRLKTVPHTLLSSDMVMDARKRASRGMTRGHNRYSGKSTQEKAMAQTKVSVRAYMSNTMLHSRSFSGS